MYDHWARGHELIEANKMPAWLLDAIEQVEALRLAIEIEAERSDD